MEEPTVAELLVRLRRLEDEAAIQRLILSYGPAADAGLNSLAAALWTEDGVYDWDPDGAPQEGRAAVGRMLHGEPHQSFIADGIAHFSGPALVKLDGDQATALTYSLVMRREEERFFLWRVSASRSGSRACRCLVAGAPPDESAVERLPGRRVTYSNRRCTRCSRNPGSPERWPFVRVRSATRPSRSL